MSDVVLDASALLALLNEEPGAEEVEGTIPGAVIGAVNFSEVVAKLADGGMPEPAIHAALDGIQIHVVPFEAHLAYRAGQLRPSTRRRGLSFGDRACIALGVAHRLPILTTDRRWKELGLEVEIRLIR